MFLVLTLNPEIGEPGEDRGQIGVCVTDKSEDRRYRLISLS